MNEKELKEYVGRRIRDERKRKGLTQKELSEKIGVKHNTISSYESGKNAPEQDALFGIARSLDIAVDDLFPEREIDPNKGKFLNQLQSLGASNLQLKDMMFLQELIEKTLSMNETERGKFLESIRFTVDYYQKMNNKND